MVDVTLRVTGRLKTGADGLVSIVCMYVEGEREVVLCCPQAIWFTTEIGSEGLAIGNHEIWTGLGIMLDSFDNNGLVSCLLVVKATSCIVPPILSTTTPRSWLSSMMAVSGLTMEGRLCVCCVRCQYVATVQGWSHPGDWVVCERFQEQAESCQVEDHISKGNTGGRSCDLSCDLHYTDCSSCGCMMG